jgi:hypothetical protein
MMSFSSKAKVAISGALVAATMGLTVMTPMSAQAREGRHAAAAAGVAGGLALGAIAAGAANANAGTRVYVDEPRDCYFERRREWDGYGWTYRRVRVCD